MLARRDAEDQPARTGHAGLDLAGQGKRVGRRTFEEGLLGDVLRLEVHDEAGLRAASDLSRHAVFDVEKVEPEETSYLAG